MKDLEAVEETFHKCIDVAENSPLRKGGDKTRIQNIFTWQNNVLKFYLDNNIDKNFSERDELSLKKNILERYLSLPKNRRQIIDDLCLDEVVLTYPHISINFFLALGIFDDEKINKWFSLIFKNGFSRPGASVCRF